MPYHARNLSKSKLMAARQCIKRLYLEIHKPELAIVSSSTRANFATGNAVGELAREIYGGDGDAILIPYEGGLSHAIRKTGRLLDDGVGVPIFEATLVHGGVLVRIDALLSDGDGWRIVEVKSSTSLKDEHLFDCAIQSWVFQGLGYRQRRIALAHIDNEFVYRGNGDYRGLLREIEISEEVSKLLPEVPDWVRAARDASRGAEPLVAPGMQCNTPYECPFLAYCWPSGEFPVQALPRASKARLGRWIAEGHTDLRDVPAAQLTEKQRRVQRITAEGKAELLPGAAAFAADLTFPRYYLDFETIAPAIPRWADTRPYEALPFQWSCHYEASPGSLAHAEFIDLSGEPPMRRVAESLLRVLGRDGPVLVYSNYERVVIDGLRRRFPELAAALGAILSRLVDLKPVTEANYYHPGMAGSWSLKAVMPTVDTRFDYKELVGIQEGMEASSAYFEATDPLTPASRKAQIKAQLERYCRQDTEAMWRLLQFFLAA